MRLKRRYLHKRSVIRLYGTFSIQAERNGSQCVNVFSKVRFLLLSIFLTAYFEKNTLTATAETMTLPVMEFQDQGYKIRKVFA